MTKWWAGMMDTAETDTPGFCGHGRSFHAETLHWKCDRCPYRATVVWMASQILQTILTRGNECLHAFDMCFLHLHYWLIQYMFNFILLTTSLWIAWWLRHTVMPNVSVHLVHLIYMHMHCLLLSFIFLKLSTKMYCSCILLSEQPLNVFTILF